MPWATAVQPAAASKQRRGSGSGFEMTTDTATRVREVHVDEIAKAVAELCQTATHVLPDDVLAGLRRAEQTERSPLGKLVLIEILENADISKREMIPLCQDTGTTVVMVDVGQDV